MDFKARYGPWAIVAGASEGTGRSFARGIAARGVNVLMLANGGPLEEEAAAVARDFGAEAIPGFVDLARAEAFDQIVAVVGSREIGLYVSNAGTDYFGQPFLDSELAGWLDMIAVNTSTMVKAAHHFGGLMRGRGRGGLLMVNSGACYMGGGRLAIHTACKGFQLNFCQSLWTALLGESGHRLDHARRNCRCRPLSRGDCADLGQSDFGLCEGLLQLVCGPGDSRS